MKTPSAKHACQTVLLLALLAALLSACQSHQNLISFRSPEQTAIAETMTQDRKGFRVDIDSFRAFTAQEVGDWILVGVRLDVETQNDEKDPIQPVGCIEVQKLTKLWIGWEASNAGAICTTFDLQGRELLSITSGWARADNLKQQPEYNFVYGFLDAAMPLGTTITVHWEDGQSIHVAPIENAFLAVHPAPGKADYSFVEFFDANGVLIQVYERPQ